MSTDVKCDIAVIGGGLIGLSCAWRLAQSGVRVALFESGAIGREASYAAAGMLAAQTEAVGHPPPTKSKTAKAATFDLCLRSRAMYAAFCEELGEDVDLRFGASRRYEDANSYGVLFLAEDDEPIEKLKAQNAAGLAVQEIPPTDLESEFGPGVRASIAAGRALWLPDEGSVDNRKLCAALHRAIVRAGVAIYENTPVQSVETQGSRITKLHTPSGAISCDNVLMCAGAWSEKIVGLPRECVAPVRPVLGQMALLRGRISRSVFSPRAYLVPRAPDLVVVGSTMEERGFEKTATVQGITGLLEAASEIVPSLRDAILEEFWAGLRPAAPDGIAILGRTPLDNYFVATAHFRKGILLAPVTAQLMSDCILRGADVPSEFSITRFYEHSA